MFASRHGFRTLPRWLSAGLCIVVIGSLHVSSARGTGGTCPTSAARCPLQGCSTSTSTFAPFDGLLNQQKNHPDGPAVPKNPPFTVADTMDEAQLPVHKPATPDGKDLRATWKTTQDYQKISQFEKRQATVEGYIVHAKPGGAESCNCGIAAKNVLDTHINLVDKPDPSVDPTTLAGVSLIAEITWRIRKTHANWTVANLQQLDLQHSGARVRITGDLLYDNVHWDMIHKNQRGTLWEIHPIRNIQVFMNNRWVDFSAGRTAHAAPAMSGPGAMAPNGPSAMAPAAGLTNAFKPHWTPAQVQKLEQAFGDDHS